MFFLRIFSPIFIQLLFYRRMSVIMLGMPWPLAASVSVRRYHIPDSVVHHRRSRLQITQLSNVLSNRTSLSFGGKIMTAGAAFVLIAGITLTLLTMNTSLKLDAYRPIIFTVLGILFVVVCPMIVCRMILKAYNRRLLRIRERQLERQRRDNLNHSRRHGLSRLRSRSRADEAVSCFLDAAGLLPPLRSSSDDCVTWYPDEALPNYESAVALTDNKHWATKFFSQDYPPPPYCSTLAIDRGEINNNCISRSCSSSQMVEATCLAQPMTAAQCDEDSRGNAGELEGFAHHSERGEDSQEIVNEHLSTAANEDAGDAATVYSDERDHASTIVTAVPKPRDSLSERDCVARNNFNSEIRHEGDTTGLSNGDDRALLEAGFNGNNCPLPIQSFSVVTSRAEKNPANKVEDS